MKNASFFYLVSSEIIDINPVLRWKESSLCFFILFCFYPLHNFLAPISLTWKPVLFIWGKVQAGHLWLYFINLQSYDFNCCFFLPAHHFPTAFTHHCKNNKCPGSAAHWMHWVSSRELWHLPDHSPCEHFLSVLPSSPTAEPIKTYRPYRWSLT